MTGKEIAANLRGTTLEWGHHFLHRKTMLGVDQYCVLGIKAHEHGIPNEVLEAVDMEGNIVEDNSVVQKPYHDSYEIRTRLSMLYNLNDRSDSKESLIRQLESGYAEYNFPVEEFIEYLKTK